MKKAVLSSAIIGLQLSGWDLNFSIQKTPQNMYQSSWCRGQREPSACSFNFSNISFSQSEWKVPHDAARGRWWFQSPLSLSYSRLALCLVINSKICQDVERSSLPWWTRSVLCVPVSTQREQGFCSSRSMDDSLDSSPSLWNLTCSHTWSKNVCLCCSEKSKTANWSEYEHRINSKQCWCLFPVALEPSAAACVCYASILPLSPAPAVLAPSNALHQQLTKYI